MRSRCIVITHTHIRNKSEKSEKKIEKDETRNGWGNFASEANTLFIALRWYYYYMVGKPSHSSIRQCLSLLCVWRCRCCCCSIHYARRRYQHTAALQFTESEATQEKKKKKMRAHGFCLYGNFSPRSQSLARVLKIFVIPLSPIFRT